MGSSIVIGIDPGSSGAIGFLSLDGETAWTVRLSKLTDQELAKELISHKDDIVRAYLENVHSTPMAGVKASFTFGQAFGRIQGMLAALEIPVERITAGAWRKGVGLATMKGGLTSRLERKKQAKARSQAMFPKVKITNEDGDCLLIAEYGRRQMVGNATWTTDPAGQPQLDALLGAIGLSNRP